jgi:hypothetical protein
MQVSGQLHTLAALYPWGNTLQYPLDRRAGGHYREERTLLSLPGIGPQPTAHPYTHCTNPALLTIEREFMNLLANNF